MTTTTKRVTFHGVPLVVTVEGAFGKQQKLVSAVDPFDRDTMPKLTFREREELLNQFMEER